MQGAPKRQVNAEEMLAELKRVVESSTPAPDAPSSASTAPKSSFPDRESRRSQIDKGSARPVKANAESSIGRPTDLQKPTRPRSPRWRLTAGGLALAGAAAVFGSLALMNKAPNPPAREPSLAATGSLVRPQNEQSLERSSDSRAPMQENPQAAPSPAGALKTRPDASTASANNGSLPAQGKAEVGAPPPASSGLESAPPAFTTALPDLGAVPVPSQIIRPDGTPIATAPPALASIGSAPPLAEAPKTAVPPAAPPGIKPDGTPIATAPPAPASTGSAPPLAEAPKTAVPRMVKPDGGSIATAPPARASPDSGPQAEAPKPNATPTASAANESAEPSTPKIDSKRKPPGKPSLQKPRRSAKASAKSVAQAERRPRAPAAPKEAEKSPEPQPAQSAGNPTALAPVKAPTVQQRFADGMTHALGYLMHLPGALVPHPADPNADAH